MEVWNLLRGMINVDRLSSVLYATATALIWRTGLTNRYGRRSNRPHLGSSTNLTCFTFYIAFPLDWRLNPNWIAFVLDSDLDQDFNSNCCWISLFLAKPSVMERIKLKCETLNSLCVCLGAKKICNFDKWAPDGAGGVDMGGHDCRSEWLKAIKREETCVVVLLQI